MQHEMHEFVMKPSLFALVQMRFNMTNKFAHVLVVPAEDLDDYKFQVMREVKSPWHHV